MSVRAGIRLQGSISHFLGSRLKKKQGDVTSQGRNAAREAFVFREAAEETRASRRMKTLCGGRRRVRGLH